MLVNYICKITLLSLLPILITLNAVFGKDKQAKVNNSKIKSYYEDIIRKAGKNQTKGYNWINRWLWEHRFEGEKNNKLVEESIPSNQIHLKGSNVVLSQSSWVPVGPVNIPISYEPVSCYALGRINCLAFHPKDTNIFWVGTPGGGIWKTVNGGKSWIPLDDNLPTLAISDIAIDPVNPDIIYIGTGDYDAGGYTSSKALGVFKTTNGGLNWIPTGEPAKNTFGYTPIRKIIINPENPNELIVAAKGGIWKSNNGGVDWKKINDSLISDMEIHPKNNNVVYAAMGNLYNYIGSAGILRSTDFGETWNVLNTGIPSDEVARVDISISHADPNYIYALCVSMTGNTWSGLHSFYLSTDGGDTWQLRANQQTAANILGAWDGTTNDTRGQGAYDLVLLADPIDKNKVYAGGVNIWVSENAGKDWEIASFWIYCFGVSTHADQHYAAYNPSNEYFYWCNDGGIYRAKEILPGSKKWITDWVDRYEENKKPGSPDYKFPTAWENLTDGLAITEFYRLGLSKCKPDIVTGGSQDNSCYYYNNSEWVNYIPNYDGMETLVDYRDPKIIYGVWQYGGLCKSKDGGKTIIKRLADTIKNLGERGNWITPVAMDPENPDILYIGFNNLWRSTNGGYFWNKVLDFDQYTPVGLNKNPISIVKISYNNPNYIAVYKPYTWIYEQQSGTSIRIPGELWLTKNRGMMWDSYTGSGLPLDSMDITSIEYDAQNPEIMWATVYSGYSNTNTFKTIDGGLSWFDVSKPLPSSITINSIVHQPGSPSNILYIGTNKGVYYTDDSLDKWLPFGDNLPNAIVNELEIQPQSGEIYAATYGRGIWKAKLLPAVSGFNDEINFNYSIIVSPNPNNGNFTINILPHLNNQVRNGNICSKVISISILDIMGRKVYEEQSPIESDSFTKVIDSGLGSGIYFLQFNLDEKSFSGKLIIGK